MWMVFILLPAGAACLLWFLAKLVPDQELSDPKNVKLTPSILAEDWTVGPRHTGANPTSVRKVMPC